MDLGYSIIFATFLGPIFAVLITLWYQDRKEKFARKERLFGVLMTHRKSIPISLEYVQALNLIDAVYLDHPKVTLAWHEFYDYLTNVKPLEEAELERKKTRLLSEMAKVLGIGNLEQIDIGRFYIPQGHSDQATRNYELQEELLRVLKATERLSGEPRKKK